MYNWFIDGGGRCFGGEIIGKGDENGSSWLGRKNQEASPNMQKSSAVSQLHSEI